MSTDTEQSPAPSPPKAPNRTLGEPSRLASCSDGIAGIRPAADGIERLGLDRQAAGTSRNTLDKIELEDGALQIVVVHAAVEVEREWVEHVQQGEEKSAERQHFSCLFM